MEREAEIARLEARLRAPRRAPPKVEELREALLQRAAEWKATLRAEPKVARLLVRRLVEPLRLHDESERPEWIRGDVEVKDGLLDGLVQLGTSPTGDVATYFDRPIVGSTRRVA